MSPTININRVLKKKYNTIKKVKIEYTDYIYNIQRSIVIPADGKSIYDSFFACYSLINSLKMNV